MYPPRKPEIHIRNILTAQSSTSPFLFAPIIASYGLGHGRGSKCKYCHYYEYSSTQLAE